MKNRIYSAIALLLVCIIMSCGKNDTGTTNITDDMNGDNPKDAGILAVPIINSISPSSAEIGDEITITGNNFGPKQGSGYWVTFGNVRASVYKSWTRTKIVLLVPSGTAGGDVNVIVVAGRPVSAPYQFTILESTPVQIGDQVWMGKNLDVEYYRDGTQIPQIVNQTDWDNATYGAWCYYNNDPANGAIYGKLYNWYAVNDPRGLAPEGWHIPTDGEWKTLSISLGMSPATADLSGAPDWYYGTDEGNKLKEQGTSTWSGRTGTNSSGFTALPGGWNGMVYGVTGFYYINGFASFWSSSEAIEVGWAWMRGLSGGSGKILNRTLPKYSGMSVRCVMNP